MSSDESHFGSPQSYTKYLDVLYAQNKISDADWIRQKLEVHHLMDNNGDFQKWLMNKVVNDHKQFQTKLYDSQSQILTSSYSSVSAKSLAQEASRSKSKKKSVRKNKLRRFFGLPYKL